MRTALGASVAHLAQQLHAGDAGHALVAHHHVEPTALHELAARASPLVGGEDVVVLAEERAQRR